ncbi:serine protease [Comamonas koreensis]|uniref:Serine protease n=2 Tax=Comamonas koreensis TaxID=160825 RepID=A0AAW4XWV9_9BURK|nr:serine protease [Comamonas koreensis]
MQRANPNTMTHCTSSPLWRNGLALALAALLAAPAMAQAPLVQTANPLAAEAAVPASTAPSLSPSAPTAPGTPAAASQPAAAAEAPPPSPDAQQAYMAARDKLVQIRTLRRQTNTQSSTGSGFFVSEDGLLITNYHVISQLALEPERHRAVLVSVSGQEAPVQLLAIDVLHDLALLRVAPAKEGAEVSPEQHYSALPLRPSSRPLSGGERIFSLGNPLDVGFAITEGTYNGLVQRSFYPRIFFGGTLNPGMSGGPAIDTQGRVVGVNVAKQLGAEQLSFLVPVEFVEQLLAHGREAAPFKGAMHAEVTRQLMAHQKDLVDRVLSGSSRSERYGPYRVPVPSETLARCWGDGRERRSESLFDFERSQCRIDSEVFTGDGDVGGLGMRYEAYDAPRLSPWQFAHTYGSSFANEPMRKRGNRVRTGYECREDFVAGDAKLPLRAVVCMAAYRKFSGLYDLTVLAVSVDQPRQGVLGRLNVSAVSFDNAQRLARQYLQGFSSEAAQ